MSRVQFNFNPPHTKCPHMISYFNTLIQHQLAGLAPTLVASRWTQNQWDETEICAAQESRGQGA